MANGRLVNNHESHSAFLLFQQPSRLVSWPPNILANRWYAANDIIGGIGNAAGWTTRPGCCFGTLQTAEREEA
jgi:hypothetical protein